MMTLNDNTKNITIRVTPALHARVRKLPRDINYADALREFLTDFVSEILDQEKSVENSTVNDPLGSDRAPMTNTHSSSSVCVPTIGAVTSMKTSDLDDQI